jgi:SEC-C motif
MGAIADAIVAYGQPLIDQTDGSPEELERALAMTTLCYNLALSPEERRDTTLSKFRSIVNMDDAEFDAFQRSVIAPMIRRHQEMFPRMHQRFAPDPLEGGPAPRAQPQTAASAEKYPGTDRYAPCPCNSGEKYKFCCGKKGR